MIDGRVSMVLGTHTHVATADEQILPGGTAFQCDVGMTGPHNGILGRDYSAVLDSTLTLRHSTLPVASGDMRIHGSIVEVNHTNGRATKITRVLIDEKQAQAICESK
jgi:calcineurin-like phosphoesterase